MLRWTETEGEAEEEEEGSGEAVTMVPGTMFIFSFEARA